MGIDCVHNTEKDLKKNPYNSEYSIVSLNFI